MALFIRDAAFHFFLSRREPTRRTDVGFERRKADFAVLRQLSYALSPSVVRVSFGGGATEEGRAVWG